MEGYVYILESQKLRRYYIGSTCQSPNERLVEHLEMHYGNTKFTAKADDWVIVISFKCLDLDHARRIERFIKNQKSRVYIEKMLNDRMRVNWLIEHL